MGLKIWLSVHGLTMASQTTMASLFSCPREVARIP
jgi:hypothetical protein